MKDLGGAPTAELFFGPNAPSGKDKQWTAPACGGIRVRWVEIDVHKAAEDVGHLIKAEERLAVAMAILNRSLTWIHRITRRWLLQLHRHFMAFASPCVWPTHHSAKY